MANRKEDEKNERIIRNLLKLPDNRRCINCNSLGPQYVCTNFWTFVCTNCSGIHREFTHRVKSISMAKFTSQEVSALQGGGNASAKEIYFKEWDPQRQSLPDGGNVERLRDFIKHVYVERRYSGERNLEKPPRAKMGENENSNDRRMDSNQSGSRSPPYEDVNERRYSDRPSPGGRSSGGRSLGNDQYSDHKISPARTEVVNDWRRDDRFGNGRRSDDNITSDGGSRFDSRSPDRQRDLDASSPPTVRPVRDILGENVTPLRVIEPPKTNGTRPADGSLRTQRTASSSSLASSNGNPAEIKVEASLIDFDAVPEPPLHAAVPQPQQSATGMPVVLTAPSGGDNWANFDSMAEVKVLQAPVNSNLLESVLSELSMPASASGNSAGSGTALTTVSAGNFSPFPNSSPVAPLGSPFGSVAPTAAAVNNFVAFPSTTPTAATGPISLQQIPGGNSFGTPTGGQWPQPQPHSLFPAMGGQPSSQALPPSNQPWNPLVAANSHGLPSVAPIQASQPVVKPATGIASGVTTQNSSLEVKSTGRNALPEDLFALNYSSISAPVPGWHTGPPHGMGYYAMQYNMQMPMQSFPQASKSTNPFDVNNDPSPAPTFPSMVSLQSALPTMTPPTGLLRASSTGTPAFHPSARLPQAAPYASVTPSNTYMGQQIPGSMPSRPHGQVNFGLEGAAFGSLNANQQLRGLQSAPAATNTFPSIGGNPFG